MAILLRATDDTLSNAEIDSNFKTIMGRYATVASADPLTLTDEYNRFNVTGTTTINTITDRGNASGAYGDTVILHFAAALQLTDSANLLLPNNGVASGNAAVHITTAQGDAAVLQQESAGVWRCVAYQRADGSSLTNATTSMTLSGDLSIGGHAHFGTKDTATIAAGALAIDWSAGNKQYVNLSETLTTGDVTFTPPDGAANLVIHVNQVAAFTIDSDAWPATVLWPAGAPPIITATAGADDIISFYYDGTNYFGSYLQAYA